MGLPILDITFKGKARTFIKRGSRGVVALILRDKELGIKEINSVTEIPKELSKENKDFCIQALLGHDTTPKKLFILIINEETEVEEALNMLETIRYDYMAFPLATKEENEKIAIFIKEQIDKKGTDVKAVLYETKADHEGVINFTTKELVGDDGKEIEPAEFTGRLAGFIAGTSLNRSTTYGVIPELSNVERLSKEEADKRIDNGEFILIHDGEKVKVARGVNSLTTTSDAKNAQYKKILLVEKMHMWREDIKRTIADEYVGKYPNPYSNKVLVLTAIQIYNKELELEGILDNSLTHYNQVGIDIEKQKLYLMGIGEDIENMDENEVKKANTDDKVFIECKNLKFTDAMEDFYIGASI